MLAPLVYIIHLIIPLISSGDSRAQLEGCILSTDGRSLRDTFSFVVEVGNTTNRGFVKTFDVFVARRQSKVAILVSTGDGFPYSAIVADGWFELNRPLFSKDVEFLPKGSPKFSVVARKGEAEVRLAYSTKGSAEIQLDIGSFISTASHQKRLTFPSNIAFISTERSKFMLVLSSENAKSIPQYCYYQDDDNQTFRVIDVKVGDMAETNLCDFNAASLSSSGLTAVSRSPEKFRGHQVLPEFSIIRPQEFVIPRWVRREIQWAALPKDIQRLRPQSLAR